MTPDEKRIVEWLREKVDLLDNSTTNDDYDYGRQIACQDFAELLDVIERGDHRKQSG